MKKRRGAAVLALIVFVISALLSSGVSLAVMDISLGINDSLADPPRGIRPVFVSNVCYVPIEVFTNYFALSYSYDGVSKTLSVSGGRHSLTFNMIQNIATDENLEVYYVPCYYENSTFMVPARVMCDVFGLRYSFLSSINTVRLSLRAANLSDREFTERYKGELMPKEPESTPVQTQTDTPAQTQQGGPLPGEGEPEEEITPDVYLMFVSPPEERLSGILEALRTNGAHATFFVSAGYIKNAPDSAARILAAGHELGIDLSDMPEADAEALSALARDTADTLARLYKVGVNAVYISQEQYGALEEGAAEQISAAGFIVWRPRITAGAGLSTVTERLTGSARTSVLLSDESLIGGISRYMAEKKAEFITIKLTTRP
ncbi:MAG: polysaccharide deacetylase family protein [Clostridia bacterium]|nr:polysaccharide deacetylase family protein [Clostridia bacterium]